MGAAVTATSLSPGRLPHSCCCSRQPTIFVVGSAATFPGSGVGDRILARRASHTTRDIVTSQNGTRSPPLWRLRETMDVHYAHTGEEATGTQYIHPIARFPSIIVIGGQSIILTTLNLQWLGFSSHAPAGRPGRSLAQSGPEVARSGGRG